MVRAVSGTHTEKRAISDAIAVGLRFPPQNSTEHNYHRTSANERNPLERGKVAGCVASYEPLRCLQNILLPIQGIKPLFDWIFVVPGFAVLLSVECFYCNGLDVRASHS